MPSKRTNDSVDRILEELNMQQAQAGLRDSVTDHQVDEILRSVGILSLPDEPLPEDKLAFPEGDALDDLLQKPDRKSTRLNSSHRSLSRMPSSA